MNILVTGSASRFAQVLLPRLLAEPQVGLVIGVDRNQGEFEHERFVQVLMDLRSPQLERVLQGMQAVINLSTLGYPEPAGGEREAVLDDMLQDTRNLCTQAARAGVPHFLHLSSALVYDPHNAPVSGMSENQPRGGAETCGVARALQGMEDWLDEFERQRPVLRIVRLRPHWILGPRTASLLGRLLALRMRPRLPDPQPLIQCVHEDDLAEAVWLALHKRLAGAVNLASLDSMEFREMHQFRNWLSLELPAALVAHRLNGAESGCLDSLFRTRLLDSSRARLELGWQPRFDQVRNILRHC